MMLLCMSSMMFFTSINMIVAELPTYLERIGENSNKGLIMSLFFWGAALSRPLSGKLADHIGRIPVMITASLIGALVAIFYPLAITVGSFFFLRFLHGLSMGFYPVGSAAYVADIVPDTKIGQSMGIMGLFNNLGTTLGFALGPVIATQVSTTLMFYISSVLSAMVILLLVKMKEPRKNVARLEKTFFNLKLTDFFVPKMLKFSLVTMLSSFCFGTIFTIIPDMSDHLKFSHRGIFFLFFIISTMLIRILAGKTSDKYGYLPVFIFGSTLALVSMLMLAHTQSQSLFLTSGVVLGLGLGMCHPALLAWTVKMSPKTAVGKGLSTTLMAVQMGSGLGAFVSGWIYDNDTNRLPLVFYVCSFTLLVSILYFVLQGNKKLHNLP